MAMEKRPDFDTSKRSTSDRSAPTEQRDVDSPSPAPIHHEGMNGGVGVLMIHGLTASPTEVAPLFQYFRQCEPDWTLDAPLLPGHGTLVDDLRQTTPESWLRHAREAMTRMEQSCGAVVLAGVSMGAVLAARLALEHRGVRALVLLAPTFGLSNRQSIGLRILRLFRADLPKRRESVERHWRNGLFSYDRYPIRTLLQLDRFGRATADQLGSLQVPTLLAAGRFDRYVTWDRFESLRRKLGASCTAFIDCANSGHVLPHEADASQLFHEVTRFIREAFCAKAVTQTGESRNAD
jgi:carboxylesterase